MAIYLLALLIGVIAGLRSMTAPAAVSWAAYLSWLPLGGTWLGFLGHPYAPWAFSVLALGELVIDQLPSKPSRKELAPWTVPRRSSRTSLVEGHGTDGDEAIHGILDMMYAGALSTTLQRTVGIHPTVSELIPTLRGELVRV